ncbi:MAG: Phenylacrylic acid decarboxylase [Candidatus Syntrophoarchaeum caldarius]|uniref:Flavin prenyltransferase UbiX n=1 Tax=Candidatus Syntropharchaeum caldarium TaxID=1838285 RepID=A0A1F2PCD3_9EURY|nr:MAG: Phenylacrylic acid decarboxylase [Candidatus Syntrophoarchaeum caldarius]
MIEGKLRLILGITGASGVIYGVRLLEVLGREIETHLVISDMGAKILELELGLTLDDLLEHATSVYPNSDLTAPISSGSFQVEGMIIAPCSMKTVAMVANGIAENLIVRAADVTLKEERKLILIPRETPLGRIHLENLLKVVEAGGTILPASPAFYHAPKTIDDLVDFVVGKVLDLFGIEHNLYRRWDLPEQG